MDDYPSWPAELAIRAPLFKATQHQDMHEFETDRGPPKRRPRGSPYTLLTADLDLNARQRSTLDAFVAATFGRPFRFRAGPEAFLVTFIARPERVGALWHVCLRRL
jgi:hypothetical protein